MKKEIKTAIYMNGKFLQVSCEFDAINSVYKINDDTYTRYSIEIGDTSVKKI